MQADDSGHGQRVFTLFDTILKSFNDFKIINEQKISTETEKEVQTEEGEAKDVISTTSPPSEESSEESPHLIEHSGGNNSNSKIRCRCGCVPNIMSLFEMAALRAQKRKEKIRKGEKEP